jgi:peptidoglycan/xylan/chitin deacetylase (PgdA/CDA1 family)
MSKKECRKSLFVISLDFELMWGVRDKRTIESYGENIKGVRKVIPSLLEIFEKYDIAATFATVGFLFTKNKEELQAYIPEEKPQYNLSQYSPYENNYFATIGNSESDDLYHYGHSLVRMIQQSPKQEIASHTFSHYYCLEGATLTSFEADIRSAKAIASTFGIDLKSIVFPRNQYSKEHISICRRLGFIAYRGNEKRSIYEPRKNQEQNKKIRAARFIDSYLNITGHHGFIPEANENIVNIPASRFLRPYSEKLKFADSLRLQRTKTSMLHAAKNNEVFHLWWHPHNFGLNVKENLAFLEHILRYYQQLHNQYGMQSKTMRSVAEQILQPHAI